MPGFVSHISFGTLLGGAAVVYLVTNAFLPLSLSLLVALAVAIGSFLPDADSDTSLPYHIALTILSCAVGIMTYFYFRPSIKDVVEIAWRVIVALAVVKFVIGPIIKKLTSHRGIWHSIPAAVIATLATFLLLQMIDLNMDARLYIAMGLGAGYLFHLILDEGTSLLRFKFLIFWSPKQSLGSALKFIGESKTITIIAYLIIIVLFVTSYPYFKML